MNLKNHHAVYDFMEKHEAYIGNTRLVEVPWNVRLLRLRLILEELGELAIAVHHRDRVLIADAVADLAYVLIGTSITFSAIVVGEFASFDDALAVKTDFEEMSDETRTNSLAAISHYVHHIISAVVDNEAQVHLVTQMSKTMSLLNSFAYLYNINLQAVFDEVHRSNMTKAAAKHHHGEKAASFKGSTYEPPQIEKIILECDKKLEARKAQYYQELSAFSPIN